jgi:hypothetical protein
LPGHNEGAAASMIERFIYIYQIANSWKDYWRMVQILSIALTNKIIVKLGL